jgi:GntR family transcriptional regulator/MocR family aminotransferase
MSKTQSSLELALRQRGRGVPLTEWLYGELRQAILNGQLRPGTRLPATRDFARQYEVSRGTAVSAFERLQAEGYLICRVGAGTWVNEHLPAHLLFTKRRQVRLRNFPASVHRVAFSRPARPFRAYEPAIAEFPMDIWARVAGRRLRRASASLLAGDDPRGSRLLREAIAAYLGSSRGVNCSADQIVIVSGAQQGLDLLARLLVKPGEAVWMEDPGYFGATAAFRNAGARLIPVPTDAEGLVVSQGIRLCHRARAVYVTPAHQFPLGMTMSIERRLALLAWARQASAFLIEDDYDSEYRFDGSPVPALQGLDDGGSVVLVGSFSKVLFPALRVGYLVLPAALVDPLLTLRFAVELHPSGLEQAILSDFILEGHLARHICRTRELYAARLAALQDAAQKYLTGLLDISPIRAGLGTTGFLRNGMSARQAEAAAATREIEVMALDRFSLTNTVAPGLRLGFAPFHEREIGRGIATLAAVLGKPPQLASACGGVARGDALGRDRPLMSERDKS